MATLLGSIAKRWKDSDELTELVPFSRVYVGRIPTTKEEGGKMPYVSIMHTGGHAWHRSNKNIYSRVMIVFHIWTDPANVYQGEVIERIIGEVYAQGTWEYDHGKVIDVLDGGQGAKIQANRPEYTAWETVKIMTFCIEEPRRDAGLGSLSSMNSGSI